MANFAFERHDFESIDEPIRPQGQNNSYDLFRPTLERRYGVYVFQKKPATWEEGRVLYVGGGGMQRQKDSGREIIARLGQQYQIGGAKLTGQTFYRNWCDKNERDWKSCESRDRFLGMFPHWRLTTLTTDSEEAIPLIGACESMLIYLLRPMFNKPYAAEDETCACQLEEVRGVAFRSNRTGAKCAVSLR